MAKKPFKDTTQKKCQALKNKRENLCKLLTRNPILTSPYSSGQNRVIATPKKDIQNAGTSIMGKDSHIHTSFRGC